MRKKLTAKIDVIGSKNEVAKVELFLDNIEEAKKEYNYRLILQDYIDTTGNNITIMHEGNHVWSKKRVLRDFKRIMKNYNADNFTDYLYQFMHLNFTIAHYDKYGWLATYQTKQEFLHVIDHRKIPAWKKDVISIVNEIKPCKN